MKKRASDFDDVEVSGSEGVGYVSQLNDRKPNAAERKQLKRKRPIGFVHFDGGSDED